jgi:hypothetical protein
MHEAIDKAAYIIGYSVIFCVVITVGIAATFYIFDLIAFKKYQKKSRQEIINYANEEPPQLLRGLNQNTIEEPILFMDALYSDICKN